MTVVERVYILTSINYGPCLVVFDLIYTHTCIWLHIDYVLFCILLSLLIRWLKIMIIVAPRKIGNFNPIASIAELSVTFGNHSTHLWNQLQTSYGLCYTVGSSKLVCIPYILYTSYIYSISHTYIVHIYIYFYNL